MCKIQKSSPEITIQSNMHYHSSMEHGKKWARWLRSHLTYSQSALGFLCQTVLKYVMQLHSFTANISTIHIIGAQQIESMNSYASTSLLLYTCNKDNNHIPFTVPSLASTTIFGTYRILSVFVEWINQSKMQNFTAEKKDQLMQKERIVLFFISTLINGFTDTLVRKEVRTC